MPAYWYEAQNEVHVAQVNAVGEENTGPFKRYCIVPTRPVGSIGLMLRKQPSKLNPGTDVLFGTCGTRGAEDCTDIGTVDSNAGGVG